jgi:hypothetical protein
MANYRKSFNLRNGVQVDDDNFVVNANGLVGIGTSVPTEYLLNVYGDTRVTGATVTKDLNVSGVTTVGILSVTQNVSVSGVVTAELFSGSASGLTDIYAIAVDGWYVNSSNSTISTSFSVGIGTTIPRGNLQIGTGVTINSNGNASYSGIITAASFTGSGIGLTGLNAPQLTGTIDNARLPSNINVGIITATTGFYGNLTGIASTASSITTTADITVNSINSGFSTTGVSTVFTRSHVGTGGTAFAALNSGRIGVGTALPTSELQIRKESGSLLEVISNSGNARISIGQSVGVGKSTALLRFGDIDRTLEILNNDTGDFSMYLHAGPMGIGTGRFNWFYGQTFVELMTLTYDGRLGIGNTDPQGNLQVGTGVTINANGTGFFSGNVNILGTISAGTFDLPTILNNKNISNTSGISTFFNVGISSNLSVVNSVGIGTTIPIANLDVREKTALFGNVGVGTAQIPTVALKVSGQTISDNVGIGTTTTNGEGLYIEGKSIVQYNATTNLYNSVLYIRGSGGVGVGTTAVRSAVDFSDAGKSSPGLLPGEGVGSRAYMLPPRLTTAQRVGLVTVAGAFIFNTDTNKFQGYTGVGWTDFH